MFLNFTISDGLTNPLSEISAAQTPQLSSEPAPRTQRVHWVHGCDLLRFLKEGLLIQHVLEDLQTES